MFKLMFLFLLISSMNLLYFFLKIKHKINNNPVNKPKLILYLLTKATIIDTIIINNNFSVFIFLRVLSFVIDFQPYRNNQDRA